MTQTPNEVAKEAAEAHKLQSPSRAPKTEGEQIAGRSADNPAKSSNRYVRVFVMQTRAWELAKDSNVEDLHEANKVAVLQNAIDVGLHPQEEATFDGVEVLPDESTALTYSVLVKLASLDERAIDAVTPMKVLKDKPGGTTAQSQVKNNK